LGYGTYRASACNASDNDTVPDFHRYGTNSASTLNAGWLFDYQ
jgi:hypothetical protein